MIMWSICSNREEWNWNLSKFHDDSIYQSAEWGQYKEDAGWSVIRFQCLKNNSISAMAQATIKHYWFGLTVVWFNGAPIGSLIDFTDSFLSYLECIYKKRLIYVRFNSMKEHDNLSLEVLNNSRWSRPMTRILSGETMIYNSSLPEQDRIKLLSGNWRHNLKRSGRYQYEIIRLGKDNINEIIEVYKAMEGYKGLKSQVIYNQIFSAINTFGDDLIIIGYRNEKKNILSIRGAIIRGKKAWDFYAATNFEGRKIYSSYILFWSLVNICHSKGIETYDMSGVDFLNNKGVFNFKKGTGSKHILMLGEWDWASNQFIRLIMNLVIKVKGV